MDSQLTTAHLMDSPLDRLDRYSSVPRSVPNKFLLDVNLTPRFDASANVDHLSRELSLSVTSLSGDEVLSTHQAVRTNIGNTCNCAK